MTLNTEAPQHHYSYSETHSPATHQCICLQEKNYGKSDDYSSGNSSALSFTRLAPITVFMLRTLRSATWKESLSIFTANSNLMAPTTGPLVAPTVSSHRFWSGQESLLIPHCSCSLCILYRVPSPEVLLYSVNN